MALIEGARCREPKLGRCSARMKIPTGGWIRWSVAVGWIAVAQHGGTVGGRKRWRLIAGIFFVLFFYAPSQEAWYIFIQSFKLNFIFYLSLLHLP